MQSSIACVILCGGASSRMGKDKAMLPFLTFETMLSYQIDKLSKIFATIYISTKHKHHDTKYVKMIYDNSETNSPLVALDSICDYLSAVNIQKFFCLSVDTPFVSPLAIEHIISSGSNCIANDHYLVGLFDTNIRKDVRELLQKNMHQIKQLHQIIGTKQIVFQDDKQFANINTPDQYDKLTAPPQV